MLPAESQINEGEEEELKNSDQNRSEASDRLLAKMREDFKKKEIGWRKKIQQLSQTISQANDHSREVANDLSFAVAVTHTEYAHLETSQREGVLKKDLQIKLLKDRIQLL